MLYNARRAIKIPNTMPLTVAALYSVPAEGFRFVDGEGWRLAMALSLLYFMIFPTTAIVYEVLYSS
jgi:hypothetical protein